MSEMLFEGDATSLSHSLVILLALKNWSIDDKILMHVKHLMPLIEWRVEVSSVEHSSFWVNFDTRQSPIILMGFDSFSA